MKVSFLVTVVFSAPLIFLNNSFIITLRFNSDFTNKHCGNLLFPLAHKLAKNETL